MERIVFYGSRVTGRARPTSDYDILVVLRDPVPKRACSCPTCSTRSNGPSTYRCSARWSTKNHGPSPARWRTRRITTASAST
ncbi:nucleotidyltransferase domain-containing protein [Longimicrobium sp.]|uniref:nucleotidyltransferase domain-containing protein n=1 Tax=Longimicrobium sp. TaxID=2029185 RepID=UPI0032C22C14